MRYTLGSDPADADWGRRHLPLGCITYKKNNWVLARVVEFTSLKDEIVFTSTSLCILCLCVLENEKDDSLLPMVGFPVSHPT